MLSSRASGRGSGFTCKLLSLSRLLLTQAWAFVTQKANAAPYPRATSIPPSQSKAGSSKSHPCPTDRATQFDSKEVKNSRKAQRVNLTVRQSTPDSRWELKAINNIACSISTAFIVVFFLTLSDERKSRSPERLLVVFDHPQVPSLFLATTPRLTANRNHLWNC